METLLQQLNEAVKMDPREAPNVYYGVANSKYRQALWEVFVERKEFIRSELNPTLYESPPPSHQINQMLRALDNPVLPIDAEDEMDEESQKLEIAYVKKMDELRKHLYSNILRLQKNFDHIKTNMRQVLRDQEKLRPIDLQDINRAVESIRRKHELMELETKQIIANKVMGFQAKIADMTKRRRNFSKEATAILQEYYENHLAHPYPTEEEKGVLAEKCHISVQQVSNWFGNRRIRTKKSQFSQDLKSDQCSRSQRCQIPSSVQVSGESKNYTPMDQQMYYHACDGNIYNGVDEEPIDQMNRSYPKEKATND